MTIRAEQAFTGTPIKIGDTNLEGTSSAFARADHQHELDMADLNPQYITLLDEVGAITYIGKADPGTATSAALWQIVRLDESGLGDEELIKLYADGNANFDNVWDNRTSLFYS